MNHVHIQEADKNVFTVNDGIKIQIINFQVKWNLGLSGTWLKKKNLKMKTTSVRRQGEFYSQVDLTDFFSLTIYWRWQDFTPIQGDAGGEVSIPVGQIRLIDKQKHVI